MTAKTARPLPASLADVALIDATTCAAAGDMSLSWWLEEVRTRRAPAPAVRMSRCTRWRLSDVAAFWSAFATRATADTQAGDALTERAKKASAAARAKRATKTAATCREGAPR